MARYIKILFAITFVVILSSCEEGRTVSNFEAPPLQDQQDTGNSSQLDKFVDVVEPYNDPEVAKTSFYQDK